MTVPNWWSGILLWLAAYRCFRLLCCDTILDRPREKVVRRLKANAGKYRRELDVFIHCPWCLGFWLSLAWWGGFQLSPHWATVAAAPLAISTALGMLNKIDT